MYRRSCVPEFLAQELPKEVKAGIDRERIKLQQGERSKHAFRDHPCDIPRDVASLMMVDGNVRSKDNKIT